MPRQQMIRFREGTAAEWSAANPVLAQGEPSLATDTGIVKVGDGVTAYSALLAVGVVTPHDALYTWPADMQHNGALITANGTDPGIPRISLADGATQRCKWVWEIPVGWNTARLAWGWTNESAGAGNVVWQFSYRLVRVFIETNVNAGAVTNVAIGPEAAPAQFGFTYQTDAAVDPIDLQVGAAPFGQFLLASLSRLGGDGADTLAGAASVLLATLTRVS